MRLSLETRVAEDVTVISCKGRIAYGAEAAARSGEFAKLAPQTRRVVIDLRGVELIDAAGLGALISVALTAQASQCSVKLAAPRQSDSRIAGAYQVDLRFRTPSHLGCRHRRIPGTSGMTDEIKFSGEVCKSFAIRNATYEDCSAILECLRSAFAPYRESYTPDAFLDTVLTPETFRHRLSEMSVFVATGTSGEVVGTIACKVLECGEGHLRGMAVHPEWQGSGVSTRLLERVEDELRKTGCRTVTLDTTEPLNRASRFYERNGFQRTGKIGRFFGMPLFEYSKSL